jgi:hypothetical protein
MGKMQLTKPERWLLILTALFVCLFGGAGWFFADINADPVVNVPPEPPLPVPNARDLYVAAHKRQVYQLMPTVSCPHTYGVDGIADWLHAGTLTRPKIGPGSFPAAGGQRPPTPTLAAMQALMAANAPVFAGVRAAFAQDYGDGQERDYETGREHYAKLRALARLLLADAKVQCYVGRWDAGAERLVDIVQLGEDIPHGGTVVSTLVGSAITAFVREECWAVLDHVSAAEARRAVTRLEAIIAERESEVTIRQHEAASAQMVWASMLRQHNWRQMLASNTPGLTNNSYLLQIRVRLLSKRRLMAELTRNVNHYVAQAQLPYARRTALPPPADPFAASLWIDYAKTSTRYLSDEAFVKILTTAFALRAYRLARGAYPPTLAALVPGYLARVPIDPYTGTPLKYKNAGKVYALSSVGPGGAANVISAGKE